MPTGTNSSRSLINVLSLGYLSASSERAAKKAKLVKDKTGKYHPPIHNWGTNIGDLPPFTQRVARSMLIDPAVRLGLAMRAAPIFGVEFSHKEGEEWVDGVVADSDEVKAYVERQMKRIWRYVEHFLSAQIWGWAAGEVTYKLDEKTGLIEVDRLLPRHAIDSRAMISDGELSGVRILQITDTGHVDLEFPKCWWHAFQPEAGQLYGQPILTGAYSPWWDKWMDGGALDVRRLFMHKDAYGGTDMTYPEGSTMVSDTETVPNRDIARQLAEQVVAGGVTARPAKYDENGNEQWKLTRATVPARPTHILEYPKNLDVEIWRGMDIADDVLSSDSTGAWAGKRVPMAAFYAGLDRWVIAIVRDILTQIIEPLVELNFGPGQKFEVPHKPLAEQAMEQQGETTANQQPTQPGQQPPQQQQPSPQRQQPGQQPAPRRMSLDPVEAVGQGVLSAAELVKAARQVLGHRMALEPGARQVKDGTAYVLNENHRWERVADDAARDERGAGFASPNVQENLTFQEAAKNLGSDRHQQILATFQEIDDTLQIPSNSVSVIGEWGDGAEDSIVTEYHGYQGFAEIEYAMAWKGSLADQKAVLLFEEGKSGNDAFYFLRVDDTLERARDVLSHHGIDFRSLSPTGNGVVIYVVDFGKELVDNIQSVVKHYEQKQHFTSLDGTARELGVASDASRESAQEVYDRVIHAYHDRYPRRQHYRPSRRLALGLQGDPVCNARRPVICGIGRLSQGGGNA